MRKSLFILPFAFLFAASVFTISFSQESFDPAAVASSYRGDINEDGQVNIFDLLEMLNMLTNPEGETERARQIADMDGGGSVNIFDLLGILQVLSGAEEPGVIYWGPDTPTPGDTTVVQGITMVSIPAGTFQMGSTTGSSIEQPIHSVTLSAFKMSEKEITNSRYAEYLNTALAAGEITATTSSVTGATGDYSGQMYIELSGSYDSNNECWISFSNNTFVVESGKENLPVVYVTWYGAKAFALKNGFDLPREAEWEYACRGGQQFEYGTDDGTISSTKANYNSNVGYPTDAGSYPKNPYGFYDMSGNVWEWCSDWFGSYSRENATDPQGPSTGSFRVVRGGGWRDVVVYCRSALRLFASPDGRIDNLGFRVVRR